jgi:hypothetical protein
MPPFVPLKGNTMKDYILSDVTGLTYAAQDVFRILNPGQAAFYVYHGVKFLDIYLSIDKKTGKPI